MLELTDIEKENESWIGIDLGTCNSVVSEFTNGRPNAVKLTGNSVIIPSAVLYNGPDDYRFGSDALGRGSLHAESLAKLFKTHIAEEDYKYSLKYASSSAAKKEEVNYDNSIFIIDTEAFYSNEYILDIFNYEGFSGKVCIPEYVMDELQESTMNNELSGRSLKAIDNINNIKGTDYYIELSASSETYDEKVLTDKEKFYYDVMKNNSECILVSSDNVIRTDLIEMCAEIEDRIWTDEEFAVNVKPKSKDDDGYIEATAFDVAVLFLRNIKKLASEYKKKSVNNVVVTVPVSFEIAEIEAVKKACIAAGFSRVETEFEPIAAGIRYFYQNQFEEKKRVLVYDFGGGTFDTTIIEIQPDANSIFGANYSVIGKAGDHHLGGDDITKLIVKEVYDNLISDYDINMNSYEDSGFSKEDFAKNENMIYKACEDCKISLSGDIMESYYISLNLKKGDDVIEYNLDFEKRKFENLIEANIIGRVEEKLNEVMTTNYLMLNKDDIDDVILVGGTSSIGALQRHITNYFGKSPLIIGNLATLVSEGAAMETFMYSERTVIMDTEKLNKKIPVVKASLKTYGVGLDDFRFDVLMEKNLELPVTVSKTYAISRNNPKEIEFSIYSTSENEIPVSVLSSGMDHVASIHITDFPEGLSQDDTFVDVKFVMNEDYTLSVEAFLKHKDDSPIDEGKTIRTELKAV